MPRATTSPINIQVQIPPGTVTHLAVAICGFGMLTATVVLGTALYAPEDKSERAFRLLNWVRKTPQPEKPQPSPQARSRREPTTRAESSRATTVQP
ncbi:MAG: hypothetical protein K0R62_8545 [Nonomuraea muscovyensis]|jgi:hypothetical protein|nr:hypothetical protein [Nonomuraea muscovyensis]